ncbi:hypothetical protein [Thalassobellus sediminis]|uniref:hypothetical protein n=1 Tax=Thalassobellus sediminis TaxID=3367753 RepID=UPI0037A811E8
MEKFWIVAITILIFTIITFLYWKLTNAFGKNEYGEKMWKNWGTRMYYWTGAIMVSGGITVGIIYLLNSTNILTL